MSSGSSTFLVSLLVLDVMHLVSATVKVYAEMSDEVLDGFAQWNMEEPFIGNGSGASRQHNHSITESKTGYRDQLGLCPKNIVIHCNCNTFYAATRFAGSINVYSNTTFPLTKAPRYGL